MSDIVCRLQTWEKTRPPSYKNGGQLNVATVATFKAQNVATVATFKAQNVANLKNVHGEGG